MEYAELERKLQGLSSPASSLAQNNPKNHIVCLKALSTTLLELWQIWCHDRFPGEPSPAPKNPVGEETFS